MKKEELELIEMLISSKIDLQSGEARFPLELIKQIEFIKKELLKLG